MAAVFLCGSYYETCIRFLALVPCSDCTRSSPSKLATYYYGAYCSLIEAHSGAGHETGP